MQPFPTVAVVLLANHSRKTSNSATVHMSLCPSCRAVRRRTSSIKLFTMPPRPILSGIHSKTSIWTNHQRPTNEGLKYSAVGRFSIPAQQCPTACNTPRVQSHHVSKHSAPSNQKASSQSPEPTATSQHQSSVTPTLAASRGDLTQQHRCW